MGVFRRWSRRLPEAAAIGGAAAVLVYFLFVPPLIGLADSGDFLRVMSTVGLYYGMSEQNRDMLFFGYFHHLYRWDPKFFTNGGYVSTQVPLLALAVYAERMFTRDGWFDIRWLSAVYAVSFVTACALLMWMLRREAAAVRWTAALVVLFVFADLGYVAYFNSFYGEPVAFLSTLFLVLTVVALVSREKPPVRLLAAYFVAAAWLAGSKLQYTPAALPFAVAGWMFSRLRPDDRRFRVTARIGAVAVVVCAAVVFAANPSGLKHINLYQSVFFGILRESNDPQADLRELGLDPKLAVNAGYHYFQPAPIPQESEEMKQLFYSRVSHADVVLFYLRHPDRLIRNVFKAAEGAFMIKPGYLGNYEPSAGKPYGAVSTAWSFWSDFKKHVVPHHIGTIALVFGLFAVSATRVLLKARAMGRTRTAMAAAFWLAFAADGLLQLVVPIVADGFADIEKHLFLFNVSFDVIVAVSAVVTVRTLARAW